MTATLNYASIVGICYFALINVMQPLSLLLQLKFTEISWLSLGCHSLINKTISGVHSMSF